MSAVEGSDKTVAFQTHPTLGVTVNKYRACASRAEICDDGVNTNWSNYSTHLAVMATFQLITYCARLIPLSISAPAEPDVRGCALSVVQTPKIHDVA